MEKLRLGLLQTSLSWENKEENLKKCDRLLRRLRGKTDIAVLPEMFTTGFTMHPSLLAEPADGVTVNRLKVWAASYELAIAGSFIAEENGNYYNRGFFVTPEGSVSFYDKRHLFRMAGENVVYAAGRNRSIVTYRGWNIALIICYDLRFPVWCRNVRNEYDVLICCANWPQARRLPWRALLQARAIENQAYVCGVNRTGVDGAGIPFSGESLVFSPKGEKLADAGRRPAIRTCTLDREALIRFRTKFPAWEDMDIFTIEPGCSTTGFL